MNFFSRAPFVRLLIPLLCGILIGLLFPSTEGFFFPIPALLFAMTILGFFVSLQFRFFKIHYLFGYALFLAILTAGLLLCEQHMNSERQQILPSGSALPVVRIRIISDCVEKDKSFKAIGEMEMTRDKMVWYSIRKNVLIYFRKNSAASHLEYGDRLIMCSAISRVPPPPNPGMFDYRAYLSNKNIFFQSFVDSSHWKKLSKVNGNTFILLCKKWRNQLLQIFHTNQISGNEFGVGAALLLGYEDKLDKDILTAYADAGVMHVLSVSGMHVAIIYVVFNALLFFLDHLQHGSLIKALILLSLLWLYATLSGLSPAVLRSAMMLSFVIAGKAFRRNSSIYNTLAASAFFLLCIDPALILDPGFQLSYLAVGGIVAVFPLIYQKDENRSWWWDQLLSLVSMSLAAQLVTFPLSLYYFHQFPNYFLLANLAIVPLSSLVIYSGIGLLVMSSLPFAGKALAWLFIHLLSALNFSVEFVSHLPGAAFKGIFITPTDVFLLYGLIILISSYRARPMIRTLYGSLFILILLSGSSCLRKYDGSINKSFIVYSIPHGCTMDFISGYNHYVLSDSVSNGSPGLISTYLQPYRQQVGCRKELQYPIRSGITAFRFRSVRFLVIRGRVADFPELLKTDYLVLSKGAAVDKEELSQRIKCHLLIIDSSCSQNETNKWKKIIHELELKAWIVSEQGAFVQKL